jgi:hypothetical protein
MEDLRQTERERLQDSGRKRREGKREEREVERASKIDWSRRSGSVSVSVLSLRVCTSLCLCLSVSVPVSLSCTRSLCLSSRAG